MHDLIRRKCILPSMFPRISLPVLVVESVLSAGDGERLPNSTELHRVHLQEQQLDQVQGQRAGFPGFTATLHQRLHIAQFTRLRPATAARKPQYVAALIKCASQ